MGEGLGIRIERTRARGAGERSGVRMGVRG